MKPRTRQPGVPEIFDRALLQYRRQRAARRHPGAHVLLDLVNTDLLDRLSLVNREFDRGLVLGHRNAGLPKRLAAARRCAWLVGSEAAWPNAAAAGCAAIAADEEYLPFAPATFDLVLSPFNLHWVNDLPGTLAQIRRCLKPDGLFLAALAGRDSLCELRQAFYAAESEITSALTPRVAPFADLRTLGDLLQRAGLALPVVDRDVLTLRYDTPLDLLADLRSLGATNVLKERSRTPLTRAVLNKMFEIYKRDYCDRDGRIRATVEIIYLTAWAPHDSQPKPLAPGTAKIPLADALGGRKSPLKKS